MKKNDIYYIIIVATTKQQWGLWETKQLRNKATRPKTEEFYEM